MCVKCITVLYQPPCSIYIYISGHWETSTPYTHSTRLCFTTDRQFYYSTIVPCELNLNVLLMANVCRLVKVPGHSVIVLGPMNKENKLLKLSWQAHISNSWMNWCAFIFKSICTSIMHIKGIDGVSHFCLGGAPTGRPWALIFIFYFFTWITNN